MRYVFFLSCIWTNDFFFLIFYLVSVVHALWACGKICPFAIHLKSKCSSLFWDNQDEILYSVLFTCFSKIENFLLVLVGGWRCKILRDHMKTLVQFSGDCDKQPVPGSSPERHDEPEREGERPKQPGWASPHHLVLATTDASLITVHLIMMQQISSKMISLILLTCHRHFHFTGLK